jgi:hypothetical protein
LFLKLSSTECFTHSLMSPGFPGAVTTRPPVSMQYTTERRGGFERWIEE